MATPDVPLYTALDPVGGFRILVLNSGPESSEIECNLVTANLNANEEFEALSYEWGSAENPKAIFVDGHFVLIRQNLWWALWHLRKTVVGQRRIWTDALCINQDDVAERGHQVALMGRIYRGADVICWLGKGEVDGKGRCERAINYLESVIEERQDPDDSDEKIGELTHSSFGNRRIVSKGIVISSGFQEDILSEEPNSRRLFEILEGIQLYGNLAPNDGKGKETAARLSGSTAEKLSREIPNFGRKIHIRHTFEEQDFMTGRPLPSVRANSSSVAFYKRDFYPSQDALHKYIEALCMHSYWRRTWVIQEVVLGKTIGFMLGDRWVDGGAFYLVAKSIMLQGIKEESLLMLDAFRIFSLRVGRLLRRDMPLIRLIEISEQSTCHDLRDRVYAMLGLAYDCQNNELTPDYSKSLQSVYDDVVIRHFYSSNRNVEGDVWLMVHASHLIQRSFWGMSASLAEEASAFPLEWNNPSDMQERLTLSGDCIGTVAGMRDPEADDSLWWTHPGLIKAITIIPPTLKPPYDGIWGWLASIRHFLAWVHVSSKDSQRNSIQRIFLRTGIVKFSNDDYRLYAPSSVKRGDLVMRFPNSNITAFVRRHVESGVDVLVARGMLLDEKRDLEISYEGRRIFTRKSFRVSGALQVSVTRNELRALTSPFY